MLYLEFAFTYGFFNRLLNQPCIPVIDKGLFGPDYRLKLEFQLVMAGLADITVGYMKIVPA